MLTRPRSKTAERFDGSIPLGGFVSTSAILVKAEDDPPTLIFPDEPLNPDAQ